MTEEHVRSSIEKMIGKVFLPALACIPANPGIVYELWDLIKALPYQSRYFLYASLSHSTYRLILKN